MLLVLLLAFALRVHLLGAQSFWNDEGNAYVQATRSFADIFANAARDIHPPGYYWLLALWRNAVGETEFALRVLSTFASVLSVAFTYALGRRLVSPGVGMVAALLVALNTFGIYYAQEARMYALLALFAVAGMWVFVGFVRQPNWRWAAALAILNAAGLWTQYAYAFAMLAQAALALLWLIRVGRERGLQAFAYAIGYYVVTNLVTIGLFWPWLPTAIQQITTWPSAGEPTPFAESLGAILNLLAYGVTHVYSNPGALAVANILLLFGLLPLKDRRSLNLLVPVAWVVVSIGVFLAFSLYRPQNLKLLLPAQIALAVWLARGVWVLWNYAEKRKEKSVTGRRTLGVSLRSTTASGPLQDAEAQRIVTRLAAGAGLAYVVFNVAGGIGPLYSDPAYQRADYRAIVERIEEALRPGDAIILDAPNQQEVFGYYYRGDAPIYTLPAGLGGDDEATRAALRTLINAHQRAFAVFWGETERDPNRVVETTLDAQTFEVGDIWYGDVRLAEYVMPLPLPETVEANARFGDHITLEQYALSSETVAPGDVLQVRLDWMTDAPLDTRYKVFVQLLDGNGVLVAQRDSEPGGGLALTTTWTPGAIIEDRHGLRIPAGLAPSQYFLIVGLYNINDPSARLAVVTQQGERDSFPLATIAIGSR